MENIHRVAHVQSLAEPSPGSRVCVEHEPFRFVSRPDRVRGISRNLGRRRDGGNRPAAGMPELQVAVRLTLDLVASFVDRAVVPATQQGQVRLRRGATLGPVMYVVALPEPRAAAGEATALVAVLERPA